MGPAELAARAPAGAEALALLLPDRRRTLLLQACLLASDRGATALERWVATGTDPVRSLGSGREGGLLLGPLLHHARSADLGQYPALATYLRTARLTESLRWEALCGIAHTLLDGLQGDGLEPVLLRGAALAATVYPEPALRHCHDLHILLPGRQCEAAASVARSQGYARAPRPRPPAGIALRHPTGFPVWLHDRLFLFDRYNRRTEDVLADCESIPAFGSRVLALSAPDSLLHSCLHAACGGHRRHLLWATDAWHILSRRGAEPDIDQVVQRSLACGAALPMWVLLEFLAETLEAPMARRLAGRLEATAAVSERVAREVALFGVDRPVRQLLACAQRSRSILFLLRWAVLPAGRSLREVGTVERPAQRWRYYRQRICRGLRAAIRRG